MTTRSEVKFGLWELRRPVFDDILAAMSVYRHFAWLQKRAHETSIGLRFFVQEAIRSGTKTSDTSLPNPGRIGMMVVKILLVVTFWFNPEFEDARRGTWTIQSPIDCKKTHFVRPNTQHHSSRRIAIKFRESVESKADVFAIFHSQSRLH